MHQTQIIYDDVRDLPTALAFLQRQSPAENGVLSVVLDTSVDRVPGHAFVTFFRQAARTVRSEIERTSAMELKEFDQITNQIETYLQHDFVPRHSGLALYASAAQGYFLAVPLPDRPAQDVVWSAQPLLTPLIQAMDEYEHVAIALVDKQEARLFMMYLGTIELVDSIESESIGRHAPGDWPRRTRSSGVRGGRHTPGTGGMIAWSGMAQKRQQRKHVEYATQHIRDVSSALMRLLKDEPFDRLVLAGTEEAVAMLRNMLPRPLQVRYTASLRLPIVATETEVLAEVRKAAESSERESELAIVRRLFDQIGTDGAVTGLDATLNAASGGRVDKLVMVSDFADEARTCPNCGRLTTETTICPDCGSRLEHCADVRERLVADVLDQSGRIEMVEGEAADLLREHGGLGAFVRY